MSKGSYFHVNGSFPERNILLSLFSALAYVPIQTAYDCGSRGTKRVLFPELTSMAPKQSGSITPKAQWKNDSCQAKSLSTYVYHHREMGDGFWNEQQKKIIGKTTTEHSLIHNCASISHSKWKRQYGRSSKFSKIYKSFTAELNGNQAAIRNRLIIFQFNNIPHTISESFRII